MAKKTEIIVAQLITGKILIRIQVCLTPGPRLDSTQEPLSQ